MINSSNSVVAGAAYLAYLNGLEPGIVLGAFAGAVFFINSATEYDLLSRVINGLVSFIVGVLYSRPVANWLFGMAQASGDYTGELSWLNSVSAFLIAAFGVMALMLIKNKGAALMLAWIQKKVGGHNDDK